MKNFIIYILFSIFSITFLYGQVIEEKETELFKKYKVKERARYDYKYTNGTLDSKGAKTSVSVYDNDGQVLERTSYNTKGEVNTVEKFSYDEHGNRVLYERKSMSGTYKKTSEYDEEDKIVLEAGYDGSAAFKTIYKYNEKNKVTLITYYADNLLDEKRVYKYEGNKATVQILQKGQNLKSTVYLTYNNNEQILEEKIISLEGVELEKRIVTYNSKGLVSKEEKYRAGKLSYRIEYQYDLKGELIKISEESPSNIKFDKKLYTYDDAGRVIDYKWTRKAEEEYNLKTFTYGSKGVCSQEYTFYPKTDYKLLSKYTYIFY